MAAFPHISGMEKITVSALAERIDGDPRPVQRVLLASLIGTTIEFFDFYAYATAAVLVFPQLFFPAAAAATLQSLATFALAYLARPFGAALFGHFGDRVGRKSTLVAALLTMGLSTVLIGLLPTYRSVGLLAPALLALCRVGQGIGLGGEWGGAVLLATENAPPGKRAWFGMYPQLGAPFGFGCATGVFLLLEAQLGTAGVLAWGWRIPFLASAVLVLVGLYARLRLTETPEFRRTLAANQRVRVPLRSLLAQHSQVLLAGTIASIAAFAIVNLVMVFSLGWGTAKLGYSRADFLTAQMIGVPFFAAAIPLSAALADRFGRWATMLGVAVGLVLFGFGFPWLFHSGSFTTLLLYCAIAFSLLGLIYGPMGAALAELFPTPVRYTGASMAFNLAGILGASVTSYLATRLASRYGLAAVGYGLSAVSLLTCGAALWIIRRRGVP
jgi:MFS family permease